MEHLLPTAWQDRPSPITIPYFQDADQDYDRARFENLCDLICELGDHGNEATTPQQMQLWYTFYQRDLLQLCYFLIDQYWLFPILLLARDEETALEGSDATGLEGSDAEWLIIKKPTLDFDASLSTLPLEAILRRWHVRLRDMDKNARSKQLEMLGKVLRQSGQVLNSLFRFLERYYEQCSASLPIDEPLGMTHFACLLLHQALTTAHDSALEHEPGAGSANWGPRLPWLKRKMVSEGWCPYMIARLFIDKDPDELALAYAVSTSRLEADHSSCSVHACLANNTGYSAQPKHTIDCTGCSLINPPLDDIIEIIRAGKLPVLKINARDDVHEKLHAISADESAGYIALSHCWADGFGCTTANTAYECQLLRVKSRLSVIDGDGAQELAIWSDTLCIPVGEIYQVLRDSQISQMQQIYKNAQSVLVLDADLFRLEAQDSIVEVGMMLILSAWSTRLWTYQEGSLNDHVFLAVADGIIDLDALIKTELAQNPDADAPQHNLRDKMLRAVMILLGRPHPLDSKADGVRGLLMRSDPERMYALLNQSRHEGDMYSQRMLHSVRDRTSTRLDDEAIIIASGLGVNVEAVSLASPIERMPALIRSMSSVPANLLFSVGDRLTEPGLRWAPKSVLRANGGYVMTVIDDMVQWMPEPPGGQLRMLRPPSRLDVQGRGLLTFLPALRLGAVHRTGAYTIAVVLNDVAYNVIPRALDHDPAARDVDGAGAGIISRLLAGSRPITILVSEFSPDSHMTSGVVVEVLSHHLPAADFDHYLDQERATQVRFCMPVTLQPKQASQVGLLEDELSDYQVEWIWPRWFLVE
jgi:hypothetical protein